MKLKDACQACETLLKATRKFEEEDYEENYDDEGKKKPQPTPQERAAQVKAKAQARPRKPWQPKNKQRSLRKKYREREGRPA